ncbi:uncharacterized protein LOC135476400 isoform X2 [Liolophura sinensis]|uniref:uncharacterized protein LOC135476400 isoform X2 n=1 Tax=Liolophura sinensis TaxID=3198878 RepID=UPI003158A5A9
MELMRNKLNKFLARTPLRPAPDLDNPFCGEDRTLPEGKEYHIYFAFHREDLAFVKGRVEALESSPYNLKCCIALRDFTPGVLIHENIIGCMDKSLVVAIVLSPDYITDEWGKFEINSAVSLSVTNGLRVVSTVNKFCSIPQNLINVICIEETRAEMIDYKIAEAVFHKENFPGLKRRNTRYNASFAERDSSERKSLTAQVIRLNEANSFLERSVATLTDEKSKLEETVNLLQQKSDHVIATKTGTENKDLVMKYDELQVEYGETLDEKHRLEHWCNELQAKCEEYLSQRNRQDHQLKQLTESESDLQHKHATLIKTFQGKAEEISFLWEKIRCQESCLVEKTQRILTLETCLKSVRETAKKADEICTRLEPLQAIPGIVASHCEALRFQITDTEGKVLEKMNALLNAWTKFREQDTSNEIEDDANSFGGENIPTHLKSCVQLLRDTVGPNWLDVGRILGLDGDQLERIWVDWGQYGMRELTERVIECWCTNCPESENGLNVLNDAMAKLEINPLMMQPMDEADKKRLRENYQLLVDDMMDVTHIEGYLRRAEILSGSALDYVLYPNTRHKRIKRLLKTLPFCGSRALSEFKNALMETGQSHLTLALAGEQCSASKTDSDVLVECLASNKNSNPNNSKGSLVECLKAKKSDDRKIFENIVEESPQAEKSDDGKIFENIIDERLEAKKCEDRKVLEKILLQCFEAKKSDDRKLFESILDERLEVKRSADREMFGMVLGELLETRKIDDRKVLESFLTELLETKKIDDRKVLENFLTDLLETKKIDDRKVQESFLIELLETKKIDDRKVQESFLIELLETKKIDDRKVLENFLTDLLETKKIDDRKVQESFLIELLETKKSDDRRSLERIDEILEPSVRASAEIKQIIYMLNEKYEKCMFYQQTETSAICPPNMSQNQ